MPSERFDVCVVGAGMAGLTAAYDLAAAGANVAVLEASDRVGGMLAPTDLAGVRVDCGAESFATRTDAVADLIRDADLPLQIIAPDPRGAWLVFEREGGVDRAPLPEHGVLGIPADPRAADVARIVAAESERDLPVPDPEPSLEDLVASRFGDDLARVIVDTVCRGVYSRGAADLRLSQVHPQLWQRFCALGSLGRAVGELTAGVRPGSAVAGIAGGLWRLPVALAETVTARGGHIRTGHAVGGIRDVGSAFEIDTDAATYRVEAVVVAGGVRTVLPGRVVPVRRDVVIGVATVDSAALDAHPIGTGALVADGIRSRAKALTHANAKWEWLAATLPEHRHIVRLSARDSADTAWLADPAAVAAETSIITGVPLTARDVLDVRVARWDAASAHAADDPTAAGGRLRVIGAAAAGTGLAAVVPHARRVAAEVSAALGGVTPLAAASTH